MSAASGADALCLLYESLAPEEQDAAYERIYDARLRQEKVAETKLAMHLRSLRRVAEVVGHAPGVDEYRLVSQQLRREGEDVQSFRSLYDFFGHSWAQAREALGLSGAASTRTVEARLRTRRLGKVVRYSEDALRDTLARAVEHYRRPPSVAEFSWWRDRQTELAHVQGDEHPNIPSNSCYRSRWKTWEGALLHFGYTPDQVALRLEQQTQVFNGSADPYLPDDLPVAELADELPEGLPLSEQEARRVRDCYRVMPRRTRYVLTVRLGLGVPKQTLRAAAEPLALHLTRIQQLQLYAQDALLHAASDGHKATRPGLRAAVIEGLRQMIGEDPAGGAHD
jgi:hypothetical protein